MMSRNQIGLVGPLGGVKDILAPFYSDPDFMNNGRRLTVVDETISCNGSIPVDKFIGVGAGAVITGDGVVIPFAQIHEDMSAFDVGKRFSGRLGSLGGEFGSVRRGAGGFVR